MKWAMYSMPPRHSFRSGRGGPYGRGDGFAGRSRAARRV